MNTTISPNLIKGLYDLVEKCNSYIINDSLKNQCIKIYCGNYYIGLVKKEFTDFLKEDNDVFVIKNDILYVNDKYSNFDSRSVAIDRVMHNLRQNDSVIAVKGWRNEDYGVYTQKGECLFKIERSASPLLGILRFGIHVNGYVIKNNKLHSELHNTYMWIAKRSITKTTHPGKLDNIVAGGLTYGLSLLECCMKECLEEASIDALMCENLKPVGCVTCFYDNEKGVYPEVAYCFDLKLPESFEPVNSDGEVESFELVSLEKVLQLICTDIFKPNSALTILDFLFRHGYIQPDTMPHDYYDLQCLLRSRFPFD